MAIPSGYTASAVHLPSAVVLHLGTVGGAAATSPATLGTAQVKLATNDTVKQARPAGTNNFGGSGTGSQTYPTTGQLYPLGNN